ncbi:MAG TPA: sigma factor, partial [Gemmataceae bacterium]|nr:sigma factor [Gemmataceae bacterium]
MTPRHLADLIDRHGPALVLFARQWCGTPEDVVQDALLKLVSLARPPDDPAAWLYRVEGGIPDDAVKPRGQGRPPPAAPRG